ncbi:MAG: hypothetical protein ASARMPREDX12_007132 [Alectoria sarmentosa]|nr:MAG: hypothetical protein ASARMPREDX12_007132 [Alectoria sarmentosa]
MVPQSRQRYGKALQLLSTALRDQKDLKKDSTLATVLCLGIYEAVSGDVPLGTTNWGSHVDVLEHLLRARLNDGVESTSSELWSYNAHVYLQQRNLSQWNRPSKETEFLVSNMRRDYSVKRLGGLVCETCHMLAKAYEFLSQTAFDADSTTTLLEITRLSNLLDQRLSAWSNEVSRDYRFTSIETPDGFFCPSNDSDPRSRNTIHVYGNPVIASMWNVYRGTRITLLYGLMKCLTGGQLCGAIDSDCPEIVDMNRQSLDTLHELFNDICASVPYLLGEIDQQGNLQQCRQSKAVGGFLLLWPLRTTLFLDMVDPVRKAWNTKQLEHVKYSLGIQRATDPFPQFPKGKR